MTSVPFPQETERPAIPQPNASSGSTISTSGFTNSLARGTAVSLRRSHQSKATARLPCSTTVTWPTSSSRAYRSTSSRASLSTTDGGSKPPESARRRNEMTGLSCLSLPKQRSCSVSSTATHTVPVTATSARAARFLPEQLATFRHSVKPGIMCMEGEALLAKERYVSQTSGGRCACGDFSGGMCGFFLHEGCASAIPTTASCEDVCW